MVSGERERESETPMRSFADAEVSGEGRWDGESAGIEEGRKLGYIVLTGYCYISISISKNLH